MRRKVSKSRVERICREILASKKWAKMKAKMGFPKDPTIRPVKFKRLKRSLALAGPHLTINRDYYLRVQNKDLKHTLTHELVHYYLDDNGINESHGKRFKQCCSAMGLNRVYAHEADYKYKFTCTCGWWLKVNRIHFEVHCQKCHKVMVSPTTYAEIKKKGEFTRRLQFQKGKFVTTTYEASPENYVPWNKKVN